MLYMCGGDQQGQIIPTSLRALELRLYRLQKTLRNYHNAMLMPWAREKCNHFIMNIILLAQLRACSCINGASLSWAGTLAPDVVILPLTSRN